MDSDTLQDLKQFIAATVSQQLSLQTDELRQDLRRDIRQDLREDIHEAIDGLRDELTTQHNETMNAIGANLGEHDDQLHDHERRITRLEHAV